MSRRMGEAGIEAPRKDTFGVITELYPQIGVGDEKGR
jgi:hypothetical protein